MLIECIVIFILIGAVILMSLRMGKKNAAIESLPLLFVPFMYILANYISIPIANLLPMNKFTAFTGLIIISAVISSLFIGFFANRFKRKRTKAAYCIMCLTFNVVFSCVLIYNLYIRLVAII